MNINFTPFAGLLGGILIGVAAVLLMLANGRIAGVSGIVGGLLVPRQRDQAWRITFVLGLWLGAIVHAVARGEMFAVEPVASTPLMLVAGLLTGFGTRMGSGCTSGHGICGIARFSRRSLIATLVFMSAGAATVYLTRHLVQQ